MSKLLHRGISISALWDPGARQTLITHRLARRLNLKGRHGKVDMALTVKKHLDIEIMEYQLTLMDQNGESIQLYIIGMDEISEHIPKLDLSRLPEVFEGVTEEQLNRPHGPLDLLIGIDNRDLFPNVTATNNECQLLENRFGLAISGRHSLIKLMQQGS